MRRASFLAVFLLVCSASLRAQDTLTLATDVAPAGGTAALRLSLLDRSATPLGIDAGSGNRIQGFAFKVLFPNELVTSVAFARAGVDAPLTPLHQTALQGTGWSSAIVSFSEASNPIPFNLNTVAPGDWIGTLTVTMRGDAPAGSTAMLVLDPGSAMLSNQAGTTLETVANGSLSLANGSATVTALQTPSNLVATASGTSQVNVQWNTVSGANHYEVWRSFNGAAFALAGSPTTPPFNDATVSASTTYLYRVRAIDGAGDPSGYSNVDAATTIVFTDDPAVALTTTIKAIHLTQLRTAVNAMRAAAGLPSLGSDPTVAVGAVVRATHITDLRIALDAARSAVGLAAIGYTDSPPTVIKAAHVNELRNGVK